MFENVKKNIINSNKVDKKTPKELDLIFDSTSLHRKSTLIGKKKIISKPLVLQELLQLQKYLKLWSSLYQTRFKTIY